jgi:hypothetical protein
MSSFCEQREVPIMEVRNVAKYRCDECGVTYEVVQDTFGIEPFPPCWLRVIDYRWSDDRERRLEPERVEFCGAHCASEYLRRVGQATQEFGKPGRWVVPA